MVYRPSCRTSSLLSFLFLLSLYYCVCDLHSYTLQLYLIFSTFAILFKYLFCVLVILYSFVQCFLARCTKPKKSSRVSKPRMHGIYLTLPNFYDILKGNMAVVQYSSQYSSSESGPKNPPNGTSMKLLVFCFERPVRGGCWEIRFRGSRQRHEGPVPFSVEACDCGSPSPLRTQAVTAQGKTCFAVSKTRHPQGARFF